MPAVAADNAIDKTKHKIQRILNITQATFMALVHIILFLKQIKAVATIKTIEVTIAKPAII